MLTSETEKSITIDQGRKKCWKLYKKIDEKNLQSFLRAWIRCILYRWYLNSVRAYGSLRLWDDRLMLDGNEEGRKNVEASPWRNSWYKSWTSCKRMTERFFLLSCLNLVRPCPSIFYFFLHRFFYTS